MRYWAIVLLSVLSACSSTPFTETSHGVLYKIQSFTDDTLKVHSNSVVWLNGNVNDQPFTEKVEVKNANEATSELLQLQHLNDSVLVTVGAERLSLTAVQQYTDSIQHVEFKVATIMHEATYAYRTLFPQLAAQQLASEQRELGALLAPYHTDSVVLWHNMFVIHQVRGDGALIQMGQQLTVNFTPLHEPNGQTKQIVFNLGKPDQVVKGFELGLLAMRSNGKAVFVIPSQLGFGANGASSGVVKPHQPVAFKVHVVAVN